MVGFGNAVGNQGVGNEAGEVLDRLERFVVVDLCMGAVGVTDCDRDGLGPIQGKFPMGVGFTINGGRGCGTAGTDLVVDGVLGRVRRTDKGVVFRGVATEFTDKGKGFGVHRGPGVSITGYLVKGTVHGRRVVLGPGDKPTVGTCDIFDSGCEFGEVAPLAIVEPPFGLWRVGGFKVGVLVDGPWVPIAHSAVFLVMVTVCRGEYNRLSCAGLYLMVAEQLFGASLVHGCRYAGAVIERRYFTERFGHIVFGYVNVERS